MIEPLKSRTMTLDELRKRTLKLIRDVRKQLHRKPWQAGPTDNEFESTVLYELEADIKQDIEVERMAREPK